MDEQNTPRWHDETLIAARHLGWNAVESAGVSDYQGWGVHLLNKGSEWAVLAWDYGSCSGCDEYEHQFSSYSNEETKDIGSPEHCASVFGELIETCGDEQSARAKFDERKGW